MSLFAVAEGRVALLVGNGGDDVVDLGVDGRDVVQREAGRTPVAAARIAVRAGIHVQQVGAERADARR